ncbi:MAG: hypothetical protein ACI4XA_03040 [Oscillospiraceae bacterium]
MDNNFKNDEMSVIYPRRDNTLRPAQPQAPEEPAPSMDAVFPGQNKAPAQQAGDGEGYFPGTYVPGAKYCKACGMMVDENAAFCAHCGKKV